MTALLVLLAACSPADPDASGARWDTGTDPRPTTTDPAPLTLFDTATTLPTDTGGDPGLCLGDGAPSVSLGTGGLIAFDRYEDGDTVAVVAGPDGSLGLRLDLLSEGLDTSASMNVILRVGVDGDDTVEGLAQDYLALVRMQCPAPGPGWIQVFASLDEALQGPAAAGELVGMSGTLALSMVDQHEEEDTVRIEVVFD